jgi:hypothetical protein
MDSVRTALAGKKTYIVAVMIIALVVVEKMLGIDVPGYDAGPDWFNEVLAALGLSTLRAAVGKSA